MNKTTTPPPTNGLTRRELFKYGKIATIGISLAPIFNALQPLTAFATSPEKVEPGAFVERKYNWSFSFSKTTVENNGCAHPLTLQNEIYTRDNYRAKNVLGHRYYSLSELSKIKGVGIRWTGGTYTDGTPIDLVATVSDYQANWRPSDGPGQEYNYFYCATVGELNPPHEQLRSGINSGAPLIEFCGFKYLDIKFNFYKGGTSESLRLAGHTTLSDCDWGERTKFDGVDFIYISKNNDGIFINPDDSFEAIAQEQSSLENSTASIYFDCSEFTMRYYGNPWKVGLCCLDNSSLSSLIPPDPIKSYKIVK